MRTHSTTIGLAILSSVLLLMASNVALVQASTKMAMGGGWFDDKGAKNTFSLYVTGTGDSYYLTYKDRAEGYKAYMNYVVGLSVAKIGPGMRAIITGHGTVNGEGEYYFHVTVWDYGEPGKQDEIYIGIYEMTQVPYPVYDYSSGVLGGGNIQVSG